MENSTKTDYCRGRFQRQHISSAKINYRQSLYRCATHFGMRRPRLNSSQACRRFVISTVVPVVQFERTRPECHDASPPGRVYAVPLSPRFFPRGIRLGVGPFFSSFFFRGKEEKNSNNLHSLPSTTTVP